MDRDLRRLIAFPCDGDTLVGSFDEATGTTGLLIVSGGNEVRSGAHRGMALLAADVAAAGYPVFRYDRRGVGDSSGENLGFLSAEPDLVAAIAAFRAAAPLLTRIVGLGNCDAASTLALFGRDAGIDIVILANPWIVEDGDDLPPAAAIRARYAERLLSPAAWWRLATGGVDLRKLVGGLGKLARPQTPSALVDRVVRAIEHWRDDATILLANRDNTARAFRAAAPHLTADILSSDSHGFARAADKLALRTLVLTTLRRAAE